MDAMFLTNQQQLAFKVALLPILRQELDHAEAMVKQGFKGNAGAERGRYNQCVWDIKALASEM